MLPLPLLMVLLFGRQAATERGGPSEVQGVRQGAEEGVGAGGAQLEGAARPHRRRRRHRLLREGRRRGGELGDGRGGERQRERRRRRRVRRSEGGVTRC